VQSYLKRATLGTSVWFFLNAVAWASLAVRLPEIKTRLEITNGQLGLALFAGSVGAISALQLAGKWSATYGSSPVMRAAVLGEAIMFPVVASAPGFTSFAAAACVFMFAIATMDMAMNAHAVTIEHESGRLIMGRMHGLWSVGGIAGGLIGGGFAAANVALVVHAITMSVFVTVASVVFGRSLLPAAADRHAPTAEQREKRSYPLLLWLLGLVAMCATIGEGAAIDWGALLLREEWNVTAFVASLPYVVFQSAMVIGRFSSDNLSQRFGRARVLLVCGSFTTVGLTIGLLIGDVVGIMLGWFLLGLGVSVVFPMMMSVAGAIAIREYSTVIAPAQAVSMVAGIAYASFLAGPPLLGYLGDAVSLRWAMLVPAVLGVGILAGSRIAKRVD
jgi:MFS family permease